MGVVVNIGAAQELQGIAGFFGIALLLIGAFLLFDKGQKDSGASAVPLLAGSALMVIAWLI